MKPIFILLICLTTFGCTAQITDTINPAVKWYTVEEAMAMQEKTPKMVFMDIYTNWCGWCKRMDATTFQDPAVVKYLNENFYPVKLNAETKDTLTFMGKDYTYKPEYKANELPVGLLQGKLSYPSMLFLNAKEQKMMNFPGFQTAEVFLRILHFLNEEHYKTTDWQTYDAKCKAEKK